MATTQYYAASSIDGFIADQDDSLDWLFEIDEHAANPFGAFFSGVGAFAMGANTYEWVLANNDPLGEPQNWHDMYGDVPCWVFTNRTLPLVPDAYISFVSGDVTPVHAAMTAAAKGRNVWVVGGGGLAAQFADAGLLDQIVVGVAPVTLGSGAPLLPRRLTSSRLSLAGLDRVGEFAYLTYDVRPPVVRWADEAAAPLEAASAQL